MTDDADAPKGYGKPPIANRIKPDEVRNPWGRKGKPKLEIDFLAAPFALKMDGKSVTVTRDDAIDFALFKAALAGNVSAAKELARRRRERAHAAKDAPIAEDLADDDKLAWQHHVERELEKSQAAQETETVTPLSPQLEIKGKRP